MRDQRLFSRRLALLGVAAMLAAPPALAEGPIDVGEPPAGKALIVFFRRWGWGGGAVPFMVREGESDVGALANANYFVIVADPGWHTYWVRSEKKVPMNIELEADETYYVQCEMGTGWLLYQPMLMPSEQRVFDELSATLHRSKASNTASTGDGTKPPASPR